MDRIRIMHVVNGLATGGTEQGVRKLLAGLDPAIFEQSVCTVAGKSAGVSLPPVPVMTVNDSGTEGWRFLVPRFAKVFTRQRPHVVHSRNWGTIESILAARLCRIPAIVHSEHGRDVQTMGRQPWRRRVLRRASYRMADRVFTVSRELGDYYARELSVSPQQFQVIPNGVDTQQFRPDAAARKEIREKLGIESDAVVVGTVSRLDPVKDHRSLLRASAAVLAQGIKLRVIIVGEGGERQALQAEADKLAIAPQVVFAGETANVAAWLNSFDIFALPSLSEGMSNTLLEAMAVGLPPVASRVGGNPELIEEGGCGLLVEPGAVEALAACLKQLAERPPWRLTLGGNARRRIECCFSLQRMLDAYSELYLQVVGRQGAVN